MSKHDKQKLSLPKINKQMTARDITDAFKAYTSHRAAEYYAILPYTNYIAESYNPEDGTYAEAPDKERKYAAVPKCLQPTYDLQSELIFREMLSCIGQAEMAKITSTFRCGVNKQEKARTAVGDGVAAFRNLLSKHGKNDAYTITDLEDRFSAAPHDFTFGSPARKVQNLRAQLSEVLQLGVKLKASQTMIPIIDILSDRHPKFAVVLHQYTNGGQTPNDCAITLEQMFSDIEETSSNIERAVGSEIWQAQAHAYSASGYRSSWQAYANDQTCADDQAYADNQDIQEYTADQAYKDQEYTDNQEYTDDQAYEDQEYTDIQEYTDDQEYADEQAHADEQDDDQSSGNTCDAEGCDAKSEWYKFCYECHQKGIEQGFLICTDGYKQTIRRSNRRQKIRPKLKRQIITDSIANRSRDCQH